MRVEVTKEVSKHLRQTWQFNMFNLSVVFVGYVVEEKPPRKRKWRVIKQWDKYTDVMIRVMDLANYKGIDLEFHVKAKMRYNSLRPYKHGKKY